MPTHPGITEHKRKLLMKSQNKKSFLLKKINVPLVYTQAFPFAVALLVSMAFSILDTEFQISYFNPYIVDLVSGVCFLITSITFLLIIIEQEIAVFIFVRGKLAVVIGVIGFAIFLFMGGGMIVFYFIDTVSS